MLTITLIILCSILLVLLSMSLIIIRGFIKQDKSDGKHKQLTGKEIEFIRRKLASVGLQAITKDDVYNLIKTLRDSSLGLYKDDDPYFPADPYEDIDLKM